MIEIRQSDVFEKWFLKLRDPSAKARIEIRLRRVALGNLGDVKYIGDGVSEIRVDYGPGYRVYFTRIGEIVILLLCGGDKASQDRDINTAKTIAEKYRGIP